MTVISFTMWHFSRKIAILYQKILLAENGIRPDFIIHFPRIKVSGKRTSSAPLFGLRCVYTDTAKIRKLTLYFHNHFSHFS